jgi:glycosyltransferase involved in cell wall biosynthesis
VLSFATFYPSALVALIGTLHRGDIVVLKTDPPLVSVVGLLAAKLRGALAVNWLQDVYPEVAVELRTPMLTGKLGQFLARLRNLSLRSAHMNVVIGHGMAEKIAELGVPRSKIMVVPNWSDENSVVPVDPGASSLREECSIPPSSFVLGYSGNLGKAHEAETLFGAARLLKERRDIVFLFTGGGSEMARLQTMITESGLTNVIFRPHQPRDRLSDALGAADAHWLSLRPELEGLIVPSKLYGIFAAGRPVVAVTDLSGEVANVVRHHECGLAVQPGDEAGLARAIVQLADDPAGRHQMGRNARAAAEGKYAKAHTIGRWVDLLLGLATGRSKA